MNISLKNLMRTFVIFFAILSRDASAHILIYAGTFDPFHNAHLAELVGGIKELRPSKAIILPVEGALYARAGTEYFPKLFPFERRFELIDEIAKEFKDTRVETSEALKFIQGDVFETLVSLKRTNEPVWFLIGTDVLEIWENLPGFQEFQKKVGFVVSRDPESPELWEKFKDKYTAKENIRFIASVTKPLRAAAIKREMLNPRAELSSMLPRPFAEFVTRNRQHILAYYKVLLARMERILEYASVEKTSIRVDLLRNQISQLKEIYLNNTKLNEQIMLGCERFAASSP